MAEVLGPDPHSYANYLEVQSRNTTLVWVVDFEDRTINGKATIIFEILKEGAEHVLLDSRNIDITRVVDRKGEEISWTNPRTHEVLGKCLQIPIPAGKKVGEFVTYSIEYKTTKESSGIDWFEPHQTSGGQYPFMYTQFQAILARTAFPCQDTPAVKSTYELNVTVPYPLVAACSGHQQDKPKPVEVSGKPHITYHYRQPMPIPSYLVAVAIGNIDRHPLGGRAYVWCEPELCQKCKHEFVQTEDFIKAAEKVAGLPYLWGPYDILVLPFSFPYGGMENANLTFVNPALVVGDRSLVDVVAHEISHSWTGNLVTNNNWSDFWINEGFTMYMERAVIGEVFGEEMSKLHGDLGYGSLLETMVELKEHENYRKLRPDIVGEDPDDSFSRIPYEKGCLLVYYLESLVGHEKFRKWLQNYLTTFKEKSISHKELIQHFEGHFPDVKVDWDDWLNSPEIPKFDSRDYLKSSIAQKLLEVTQKMADNVEHEKYHFEHTIEAIYVLDKLLAKTPALTVSTLESIDNKYKFSTSVNAEIQVRWLGLQLQSDNYVAVAAQVNRFLSHHGRGIYIKPIWRQLGRLVKENKVDKKEIQELFEKNRLRYHSALRNSLTRDIQLQYTNFD